MKEKIEQFSVANQPDNNIVELIQKQQKQCSEHVTELTTEQIEDLLKQGNYFFVKQDDKILASGYKMPLINDANEDEQIYRLGGLSILDFKNSSVESKKNMLLLFQKIKEHFEKTKAQLIMKTDNPVLARVLKSMGAEELSYDECLEKYPSFLEAYIGKSEKSVEYYKTQNFYVKGRK